MVLAGADAGCMVMGANAGWFWMLLAGAGCLLVLVLAVLQVPMSTCAECWWVQWYQVLLDYAVCSMVWSAAWTAATAIAAWSVRCSD